LQPPLPLTLYPLPFTPPAAKDNERKPGKKGISLLPEQWSNLVSAAPAVSEAVQAGNESYSSPLGGT